MGGIGACGRYGRFEPCAGVPWEYWVWAPHIRACMSGLDATLMGQKSRLLDAVATRRLASFPKPAALRDGHDTGNEIEGQSLPLVLALLMTLCQKRRPDIIDMCRDASAGRAGCRRREGMAHIVKAHGHHGRPAGLQFLRQTGSGPLVGPTTGRTQIRRMFSGRCVTGTATGWRRRWKVRLAQRIYGGGGRCCEVDGGKRRGSFAGDLPSGWICGVGLLRS